MLDDLFLIVASVGAATGAGALLRRRTRRVRASLASFAGAGARQLADTLGPDATEPLPFAGPAWRSLAETLEPRACDRLRRPPEPASRRATASATTQPPLS